MPGVVRAITRIQDADDFTGSLTDTYIPVWSNSQQKFVMTAQPSTTPGGSNTQVQYNSSGAFAGHSGFVYDGAGKATLSSALIVPVVRPAADSTTALKITKADGTTAVVTVDTANGYASILNRLTISAGGIGSGIYMARSSGTIGQIISFDGGATLKISGIGGGNIEFYQGDTLHTTISSGQMSTINLIPTGGKLQFTTFPPSQQDYGTAANRYGIVARYTNDDLLIHSRAGVVFAINGGASGTTITDAIRLDSNGYLGVGVVTGISTLLDIGAATNVRASLRIRSGTAPTSPNSGDLWYDGTNLKFRDGTTTRTITWT